jgi:hypothetical protein
LPSTVCLGSLAYRFCPWEKSYGRLSRDTPPHPFRNVTHSYRYFVLTVHITSLCNFLLFSTFGYWRFFREKYVIFCRHFLLIYELKKFPTFLKTTFLLEIMTILARCSWNLSIFKEGVIIEINYIEQVCQVWYYECIDMKVFASRCFLQHILQRRFRYVKAFKNIYRFFPWCFTKKRHKLQTPQPPLYWQKLWNTERCGRSPCLGLWLSGSY